MPNEISALLEEKLGLDPLSEDEVVSPAGSGI